MGLLRAATPLPPDKPRVNRFFVSMKNLLLLTSVVALFTTGCIHYQETVVQNDIRTSVTFESDTAARIFYETLSKSVGKEQKQEKKIDISIPIVFAHETKVVYGPNRAFNDAVNRCDTNHDGRITEQEARIYSETVK